MKPGRHTLQEYEEKEQEILAFVRSQIMSSKKMPTIQEIGKATGIKSFIATTKCLDSLELKGYIKRSRYKYGMEILERDTSLPMTCSPAVSYLPDSTDPIAIPLSLLPPVDQSQSGRDLFAITAKGDSMRNFGIMDGDTVIARRQQIAKNGDIAVVTAIGYDDPAIKIYHQESDFFLIGRVVMSIKQFRDIEE